MTSRIRSTLCLLVGSALVLSGCASTNYDNEMQKTFERTFGHSFPHYQYFGMPVSEFGVGTMYPKFASNSDFDPTTSGIYGQPSTWWNPALNNAQKEAEFKRLFGDAETGAVTLQTDREKQFDVDVTLPSLYKLLSVDSKTDFKSSVKVTLSADSAYNHRIDWDVFASDLSSGTIKESVKQHYNAADCLITTGDIVLLNYSATLVVVKSLDAEAQAKLTAAWKSFGQGASASFKVSDANSGTFTVKSTKPVVVATYIGTPPPGQTLAAGQTPEFSPILLPDSVRSRLIDASLRAAPIPVN